jgi:serine/threonine-protein kinase Stk1
MGAVYRARDLLREQFGDRAPYVAIKTLTDDFAHYPDAGALLHTEFALTMHLHHPNIIRFYGFEVDPLTHHAFISLELLQGQTLNNTLADNPVGLGWAAREITLEELAASLESPLPHQLKRWLSAFSR